MALEVWRERTDTDWAAESHGNTHTHACEVGLVGHVIIHQHLLKLLGRNLGFSFDGSPKYIVPRMFDCDWDLFL